MILYFQSLADGALCRSRLSLEYECKKAMPEKIVSLYSLGSLHSQNLKIIDGIEPGQYCDYSVADYNRAEKPGIGMTLKQCAGMSIELFRDRGDASTNTARSKKNAGYGYYISSLPLRPNTSRTNMNETN